jgi:hypothetical protein
MANPAGRVEIVPAASTGGATVPLRRFGWSRVRSTTRTMAHRCRLRAVHPVPMLAPAVSRSYPGRTTRPVGNTTVHLCSEHPDRTCAPASWLERELDWEDAPPSARTGIGTMSRRLTCE